jgi:hypothetical protein
MDTDGQPLYARILRDDWRRLATAVRALHATRPLVRARGPFRVEHGTHRVARVLARLLRLPPARAAVDTRLVITAIGDSDRWERVLLPTGLVPASFDAPPLLRWCLVIMAAGVLASGARDLYAAYDRPHGSWPWR